MEGFLFGGARIASPCVCTHLRTNLVQAVDIFASGYPLLGSMTPLPQTRSCLLARLAVRRTHLRLLLLSHFYIIFYVCTYVRIPLFFQASRLMEHCQTFVRSIIHA